VHTKKGRAIIRNTKGVQCTHKNKNLALIAPTVPPSPSL